METNEKKLTPQLRFPEFKNSGEWAEKKLGDISYYISSNYSVSSALEQGKYYLYDANKLIGFTNEYLCDRDYISIIKDGSGVGRTRYMNAYNNIIGTMGCIVPNNNINSYFLYSLINNINFKQYIKGATIPHIYYSDYSKHIVFIPPLKEQEKIADFLSSVDELIEIEKIKLENLKEYKKGLLQNLFPKENQKVPDLRFPEFKNSGEWEEKKLDEIVDILDNLRQPIAKYKRTQGNYPYYGANGIMDYINAYIFDGTYLLIGEDGSVINKDNSPIMHIVAGKFWVNNHAHVVKEKSQLYNLYFIYYALHNTNIEGFVKGVPPKLNQANLRQLKIIMTDIIEQEKIANVLLSIDELIIAQIRKILLLKEYKKGLLQQLFPNNN